MTDRSIRVESFVRMMLDGLDSQLATGGPCTFFARAPRDFNDADINAAAQALHDAGRVCMFGLSHTGSKYTTAFLAFRICMPECYPHYREQQARGLVWLTGFACTLITALLCFFGEYLFHGWFWPAMGVAGLFWLAGAYLIRNQQIALQHLEMPSGPLFEWINYG